MSIQITRLIFNWSLCTMQLMEDIFVNKTVILRFCFSGLSNIQVNKHCSPEGNESRIADLWPLFLLSHNLTYPLISKSQVLRNTYTVNSSMYLSVMATEKTVLLIILNVWYVCIWVGYKTLVSFFIFCWTQ